MSQQLISHSPDLKRLRDEGYEIEVIQGFLLVHHVPYVNAEAEIGYGILVSELTLLNNNTTARPGTHVVYFRGEFPCYKDGSKILGIEHSSQPQTLAGNITVDHCFSNKPSNGYADYYEKVSRYAEMISGPAMSLDPNVKLKTFSIIPDQENATVFRYIDTNSSRAGLVNLNKKFHSQRVGIIGLGGTGAYILDLISKTEVPEIHLFDGDDFFQHNAFRAPGAATLVQLDLKQKKVDYYASVYGELHKGIIPNREFINHSNVVKLAACNFVFICVDKNSVRKLIIDYLVANNIAFIDTGIGVHTLDDCLIGSLRVTTSTVEKHDHLQERIAFTDDKEDDLYATNIQIADLNALNAAFAVIKWKKLCGFYQDLEKEHQAIYSINVSQLTNEDLTT